MELKMTHNNTDYITRKELKSRS